MLLISISGFLFIREALNIAIGGDENGDIHRTF